eukprot:SAG22_NODE_2000_length_3173_cov_2.355563_2_plen_130_part_00
MPFLAVCLSVCLPLQGEAGLAARFGHALALDLVSYAGREDLSVGEEEGVEESEFVRQAADAYADVRELCETLKEYSDPCRVATARQANRIAAAIQITIYSKSRQVSSEMLLELQVLTVISAAVGRPHCY